MITTKSGQTVAVYEYDAYGKVESVKNALGATITSASHIGLLNPMRYRGYCYDNETGLYYLISRYYDPTTGRFVNADDLAYLGSNGTATSFNLYSYSEGNPINNVDLNNCVQVSVRVLLKGAFKGKIPNVDTLKKKLLYAALAQGPVPNNVYNYLFINYLFTF